MSSLWSSFCVSPCWQAVRICTRVALSFFPSFHQSLSPGLLACVGPQDKRLPPAACCAQITDVLLIWCFAFGYFAHYKIVLDGQNRWTNQEYDIRGAKHLSGWSVLIRLAWLPSPWFGKLQLPKVGHCGPHVRVVVMEASTH